MINCSRLKATCGTLLDYALLSTALLLLIAGFFCFEVLGGDYRIHDVLSAAPRLYRTAAISWGFMCLAAFWTLYRASRARPARPVMRCTFLVALLFAWPFIVGVGMGLRRPLAPLPQGEENARPLTVFANEV